MTLLNLSYLAIAGIEIMSVFFIFAIGLLVAGNAESIVIGLHCEQPYILNTRMKSRHCE